MPNLIHEKGCIKLENESSLAAQIDLYTSSPFSIPLYNPFFKLRTKKFIRTHHLYGIEEIVKEQIRKKFFGKVCIQIVKHYNAIHLCERFLREKENLDSYQLIYEIDFENKIYETINSPSTDYSKFALDIFLHVSKIKKNLWKTNKYNQLEIPSPYYYANSFSKIAKCFYEEIKYELKAGK